tara:strand:- start:233 stop:547 length:315 start_codon:yes stop_codon:yes gene_type:complete
MRIQIILIFSLLLLVLLIICRNKEHFTNYLSVYDGKNFYMRFLDYIHNGYRNPINQRKSLLVNDLRGSPYLFNQYSDPYIIEPSFQDFKGFFWQMPHNRRIIKF